MALNRRGCFGCNVKRNIARLLCLVAFRIDFWSTLDAASDDVRIRYREESHEQPSRLSDMKRPEYALLTTVCDYGRLSLIYGLSKVRVVSKATCSERI
jgi:hypothetical protein